MCRYVFLKKTWALCLDDFYFIHREAESRLSSDADLDHLDGKHTDAGKGVVGLILIALFIYFPQLSVLKIACVWPSCPKERLYYCYYYYCYYIKNYLDVIQQLLGKGKSLLYLCLNQISQCVWVFVFVLTLTKMSDFPAEAHFHLSFSIFSP